MLRQNHALQKYVMMWIMTAMGQLMKFALISMLLAAGLLVIHASMLTIYGHAETLVFLKRMVKNVIGMNNVILKHASHSHQLIQSKFAVIILIVIIAMQAMAVVIQLQLQLLLRQYLAQQQDPHAPLIVVLVCIALIKSARMVFQETHAH